MFETETQYIKSNKMKMDGKYKVRHVDYLKVA